MSQETEKQLELEGALIRRVLECRPEDVLSKEAEPSDAEVATLERLYTEVLGLLPGSLEPVEPTPSPSKVSSPGGVASFEPSRP